MIWLYQLARPLAVFLFSLLAQTIFRGSHGALAKLRRTWEIRWVKVGTKRLPSFMAVDAAVFQERQPIWIHAASGEFEYAKPLIRVLAKKPHESPPVFVTYFSPTYAENVRRFPGVAAACALPFDDPKQLHALIDRIKPRALLIARTDVWYNTVRIARERGIPTLLFSATFHDRSKRLAPWVRGLTEESLRLLTQIQCVTDDDAATLGALGLTRVQRCGDTRYDQVLARLEENRPLPEKLLQSLHPKTFVAGSVWTADLDPVLTAFSNVQNSARENPHTLLIAPHELSESIMQAIENQSEASELSVTRLSRLEAGEVSAAKWNVIIIDRIGILAELYRLAPIAFVGGSFNGSVHSVMEPLAAGCLVLVGPDHTNNREAIEFRTLPSRPGDAGSLMIVTAVEHADMMTARLAQGFKQTGLDASGTRSAIQNEVRRRTGATEHILSWLRSGRA